MNNNAKQNYGNARFINAGMPAKKDLEAQEPPDNHWKQESYEHPNNKKYNGKCMFIYAGMLGKGLENNGNLRNIWRIIKSTLGKQVLLMRGCFGKGLGSIGHIKKCREY